MRTSVQSMISLGSILGQCSAMLLMNKFAISFVNSDADESGTNGKPDPCPTWIN